MYLKKAFGIKKPKLEFYGGQAEKVAASSPFDLIINLSGNSLFDTVSSTATLPLFTETVQGMIDTPKLTLTWSDFGLPRLPKSAWESLALDIAALADKRRDKKQAFKVAVCCVGGTGRTGTCLAILRALLTGNTDDPVAAIRKTYKFDAVETYSQLTYVELVTGLKTREKVIAKTSYSYTSSNKTSATNPKSAKASAEVFNKANENDPVCDSTGIECPASVKHTKACDDKYHFQKTGQPAPRDDENAEAWEKLTAPVVQGVGIIPCNGEGVACPAVSHLADCSAAFMKHHKDVIDSHKITEGEGQTACNDAGYTCPGTLAHSELCRQRNVEHAEALCDKPTNADISKHVADCICSKCQTERDAREQWEESKAALLKKGEGA
jgi:hypothetical protein